MPTLVYLLAPGAEAITLCSVPVQSPTSLRMPFLTEVASWKPRIGKNPPIPRSLPPSNKQPQGQSPNPCKLSPRRPLIRQGPLVRPLNSKQTRSHALRASLSLKYLHKLVARLATVKSVIPSSKLSISVSFSSPSCPGP